MLVMCQERRIATQRSSQNFHCESARKMLAETMYDFMLLENAGAKKKATLKALANCSGEASFFSDPKPMSPMILEFPPIQ